MIKNYENADKRLGNKYEQYVYLFNVVRNYKGKCLQIGYRDKKFAHHWEVLDKYDDSPVIDYKQDLHKTDLPSNTYDIISCPAILEHVEDPKRCIAEMYRLLKPGGKIWVVVPFNQHFHPSPNDYWRVTPQGMRLWMKCFKEIDSGYYRIEDSVIYNAIYYYGEKK